MLALLGFVIMITSGHDSSPEDHVYYRQQRPLIAPGLNLTKHK